MGRNIGDWLGLLFVVALIFLLVRPGSGAVALVNAFAHLLTALVQQATDLASTAA